MFERRLVRMVAAAVLGVVLVALLGGGVAGADSSAAGWAGLGAPLAPGQTSGQDLYSISCPTASSCVAVGDYGDAASPGGVNGLVMTGAGGAWTPAKLDLPADYSPSNIGNPKFVSVSCGSVGNCAAAGIYSAGGAPSAGMLAVEVGGVWHSAVRVPNLPGGPPLGALKEISCSSQVCVAIGRDSLASNARGLLVSGTGDGKWTSSQAPLPGDASGSPTVVLTDVSCAGSECDVVGTYKDTSGQVRGLLLTYSGGAWTAVEAPLPGNAATSGQVVSVDAISCPAAGECSAAGGFVDSDGKQQALLFDETGGTWSAREGTLPAGTPDGSAADPSVLFRSIDCSAPGECAAAGQVAADPFHGESLPLVVAERGGTWGAGVSPALPSDAQPLAIDNMHPALQGAAFFTVSCSSPGVCDAAGEYVKKNGDEQAAVSELGDTTWSDTAGVPLPTDAYVTPKGQDPVGGSQLVDLSCVAGVGCEGVGSYVAPLGRHDHALIVVSGNPATGVARAARAVTSGGAVSVAVSCIGQSPCGVAFNLTAKGTTAANRRAAAGGTTVIGRATGTVAAGGTASLHFVLNAQGLKLLRRTPKAKRLLSTLAVTQRRLIVSNQRPLFKHS